MSTTDPELAHKVHVYAGEAMHAALNETGGIAYTVKAVVDAILARFAVVELPEPDGDGTWMSGSVYAIDGEVEHFVRGMSSVLRSPRTARVLAAALLAAANQAEGQS